MVKTFNSLFEMLTEWLQRLDYGLLQKPFNSLFEMQPYGSWAFLAHLFRLSILYLRCKQLGGSVWRFCARATFNSLFEMPPEDEARYAKLLKAFNSLFEMLAKTYALVLAGNVYYPFNSLFEMLKRNSAVLFSARPAVFQFSI